MQQFVFEISGDVLEEATGYCRLQLPYEACGFLTGQRVNASTWEVRTFHPIRNSAKNRLTAFAMDPLELAAFLTSRRSADSEPIGLLHSHPGASATPSAADLQTSWLSIPGHWIVSFAAGSPVVKVYGYRLDPANGSIKYKQHAIHIK